MKSNTRSCRCAVLAAVAVLSCSVLTLEAKTIGIYKGDKRLGNLSGIEASFTNAGWEVKFFGRGDMAKEEFNDQLDVMLFTGGFNMYYWTSPKSRVALNRYVAKGGGVILSSNRGGYVRSATRPLFPQIGSVSCRLSSGWINPVGDSVLAKAFGGEMRAFVSGDHLKVEVGPDGKSFCGVEGMSCGAYGEVGYGRVVVLGAHVTYLPTEECAPAVEKILMACVDWVSGTGKDKISAAKKAAAADKAECEVLRRERMYDVALATRGPDYHAGSIPYARDRVAIEPEALAYKLDYYSTFLAAKDAAKAKKVSDALKGEVGKVNASVAKVEAEIKAKLEKLDLQGLKAFKSSDYAEPQMYTNFMKLVNAKLVDEAKALIARLEPVVDKEKLAWVEAELRKDAALVPGLVADLETSTCAKTRLDAAVELGRIVVKPEAKVVAALVKALDDEDAKVRTQAAISLGWMQAKDAVDALAKKMDGADKRLQNRAVQVLGQIGDDRAAEKILKALKDEKKTTTFRQLAFIALGHLKAKAAVPALLAVVKQGVADKLAQRQVNKSEVESALIALGYIGDKSAAGDLKAVQEAFPNERPRNSKGGKKAKPFKGFYSTGYHATTGTQVGPEWAAEMALQRIAEGGRAEKGVRQNIRFRARDYFYQITGNCNALAGRIFNSAGAFRYADRLYLPAHIWEGGFTGIHNAWGTPGMSNGDYEDLAREIGAFDMCLIDVTTGYDQALKPEAELRFEGLKDHPAYHGVWSEETWPEYGMGAREFIPAAERRYGKDWRKLLTADEVKAVEQRVANEDFFDFAYLVRPDGKDSEGKMEDAYHAPWDAGLRTMLIELMGDRLAEIWTESQDYMHARRMGFAQTFVCSTADQGRYFGDNRAFNAIDSMSLESYQSFGRSTSYWMQRYRDGNARSGMAELYNWYCPSVEHARRGFYQNAVHGKCFYNFGLMEIFKQPSGEYLWRWEEGRWDAAREVFGRVRANKEFYRIKPSAAKVAVMYSERECAITRNNAYQPCAVPQRADQNAMATWVSLGQSHILADVIYADYVQLEKLGKYAVIVLNDAKYLTDAEMDVLRAWVKAGGTLIAQGATSLFDGWTAKMRKNYALADLFGADYVKTDYLPEDEADTFCRRRGDSRASFRFVTGLDGNEARFHSQDSIHRDKKPAKGIAEVTFGELTAEIDAAVGIDRVKPTTAKVVATFKDGSPAILENAFGKGRCYLQCSAYPSMGHTTSEWEMMPNKWDFWPGNREMLEKLVRSGLRNAAVEQAVEAKNLSGDVEVTVDDYGSKYVVHLLDYNVQTKSVKGGRLVLPGTRAIARAFYPDTKSDAALTGREIALREFSAYDMVVIEFAE